MINHPQRDMSRHIGRPRIGVSSTFGHRPAAARKPHNLRAVEYGDQSGAGFGSDFMASRYLPLPHMPRLEPLGVKGDIILFCCWISLFNSFAKALVPLGSYHIEELLVMLFSSAGFRN